MGSSQLTLLREVTCPHCWTTFPPEQALWVATHSDLIGDPRLGQDAYRRFLPDRFNVHGLAVDLKGQVCEEIACPSCHLTLPRSVLQSRPIFLSILGAPGSGKSYLLASMIWRMRRTMRRRFRLTFLDADPAFNRIVKGYEAMLFLSERPDELVTLRRTERDGELYQSVNYDGQQVFYPRPFLFTVEPADEHPHAASRERLSQQIVLYDNAGEHFIPGGETVNSPGTRHMRLSGALLFVYDPTQDAHTRGLLAKTSDDPQLHGQGRTYTQDQILTEAARRIRADGGLGPREKFKKPLIVVVSKFDLWKSLIRAGELPEEYLFRARGERTGFWLEGLRKLSDSIRALLVKHSPQIVDAAEAFAEEVVYVPVSAIGRACDVDPKTGLVGVRPRDVKPIWCEVPLVYALFRTTAQMIPRYQAPEGAASGQHPAAKPSGQHAAAGPSGGHGAVGGPRPRSAAHPAAGPTPGDGRPDPASPSSSDRMSPSEPPEVRP